MTQHPNAFSFEFFPPKGPKGADRLGRVRRELAALGPKFFSVTFGAGGSTQAGTRETVAATRRETGIATAPHLSCIGTTRARIRDLLEDYAALGVDRIVALRGDVVPGQTETGEFAYASELVAFIREAFGDRFHVEVAAYPEFHPEAPSPEADIRHFVTKVKAGADSAMTQYFYNADAYFHFVDQLEKAGVDIPVVPGVMPLANFRQVARFSELCGADIPRWVRLKMDSLADDPAAQTDFAEEVVSRLAQRLLEAGAPGLHFYTLNQARPVQAIWKNLALPMQD
ncbi:MAG: methylenetetrahydrofolate reductase [NAD(P)H] [Salinisphaeraceae bacterium]|jgi:methylenetetrahydrofolate reductase (NADPH)|nr:methylenetetrahydrofolate reductase [NAD(P)H] [Salinisphaeraceae bacterium]